MRLSKSLQKSVTPHEDSEQPYSAAFKSFECTIGFNSGPVISKDFFWERTIKTNVESLTTSYTAYLSNKAKDVIGLTKVVQMTDQTYYITIDYNSENTQTIVDIVGGSTHDLPTSIDKMPWYEHDMVLIIDHGLNDKPEESLIKIPICVNVFGQNNATITCLFLNVRINQGLISLSKNEGPLTDTVIAERTFLYGRSLSPISASMSVTMRELETKAAKLQEMLNTLDSDMDGLSTQVDDAELAINEAVTKVNEAVEKTKDLDKIYVTR